MFNKSSDVMIPLVVSRPIEPQMNWKRVMFSFRGRINRSTFWSYIGLSSLLYLVLALILMLMEIKYKRNINNRCAVADGVNIRFSGFLKPKQIKPSLLGWRR